MKFGKRRKDGEPPAGEDPVVVADADDVPEEPVADSWTVPGGANTTVVHERPEFEPPGSGADVYEGSAEELPPEPPAGETVVGAIPPRPVYEPEPLTYRPPTAPTPTPPAYEPPAPEPAYEPPAPEPDPIPFPVAEEPIAVVTPGPEPPHVTPLGDAAETHASGHAPHAGPTWPEDVQKLAAERPEFVVGAAFVGGLLAAMILRRLGN